MAGLSIVNGLHCSILKTYSSRSCIEFNDIKIQPIVGNNRLANDQYIINREQEKHNCD